MSTEILSQWSRDQAARWGEQSDRSISKVLGDGFRRASGVPISANESVDLVHAGMVITGAAAVINPKAALMIGVGAAAVGLVLWAEGQTST